LYIRASSAALGVDLKTLEYTLDKKYIAWVENQNGCKILVIRSDNKKEYIFDIFNKFCEQ
ncbi:unnamed protein product, partial [Dovyalis caffra]